MLTAFGGISFRPHGILPSLEFQLGGKTVAIEVEVVDVPLDYNLLLGRNWIYNMQVVVSSLFRVVCFPLDGRIVTIFSLCGNHITQNKEEAMTCILYIQFLPSKRL